MRHSGTEWIQSRILRLQKGGVVKDTMANGKKGGASLRYLAPQGLHDHEQCKGEGRRSS